MNKFVASAPSLQQRPELPDEIIGKLYLSIFLIILENVLEKLSFITQNEILDLASKEKWKLIG